MPSLTIALALLAILATPASGTTLELHREVPNLARLGIRVTISDGLTSETVVDELFDIDNGHATLTFEDVGILTPFARIERFELDFIDGPLIYDTNAGVNKIPVRTTLDEARFAVRNEDGSPLLEMAVGSSSTVQVASIDAALRGSVELRGTILPFSLYGSSYSCSECLDSGGFVPARHSLAFVNLDEFRLEGGFAFPRADANPLGEVDRLTVRVQAFTTIFSVTFVPEPASGVLVALGLVITGGLRRGRGASGVRR